MISRFTKAFLAIILALFLVTSVAFIRPPSRAYVDSLTGELFGEGGVEKEFRLNHDLETNNHQPPPVQVDQDVVQGGVIMSKLGNETAKAALGRATWKLLHTMTLRYPEDPTPDEKEALKSYFHLLSRLYPCGECAAEFQLLLKKYPPQASSRRAAASWLCHVHNQVNLRLNKPEFDCAHLDETYDCGCGDEPVSLPSTLSPPDPMDLEEDVGRGKDRLTGAGLIKGGR
ncbi:hypothetical protein OE88DRAFT_1659842 [Heliocybe sulcata]|uniref:Sulfhydryl oxidase n=1 Tax=Heliocybe sulcata TaxID=5364 RepID=A0A5C3N3U7_9AGAM|nr:hypothetical protein OE88DRAFT_1659842 [Heliocybe sulcata]